VNLRLLSICLLPLLPACGSEPETPKAKNVLLLVVDTLRADRLGCYGYERDTSPNIDALAAEGALYEHCFSQACWTVPSMISMMSGVFVTQAESALPEGLIVVAEALQARGMETAAFPANPTLCLDRGFERGFDHFVSVMPSTANVLCDEFESWYEAKQSDDDRSGNPFFVWAQFLDPHQPYNPQAEHALFNGPAPANAELRKRWSAEQARVVELSPDLESLSLVQATNKMNRLCNLYDGEVHQSDAGIGRVLDLLRASNELKDTLVIIASDHGEMLFEHPQESALVQSCIDSKGGLPDGVMNLFGNGHRPWYYENLWNTPLILWGPGIPAGVRREQLAANLDIFPTILEALDFPPIPGLQGQSLYGGLEPQRDRIFAYGHRTTAVREATGKKLFLHPRALHQMEGEGPLPPNLFDLAQDPTEVRELSAEAEDELSRLTQLLEAWQYKNRREVTNSTSAEQRKVLEDLGYVGAGLDFNEEEQE
jgi:arylsulfatase A-like enzyme